MVHLLFKVGVEWGHQDKCGWTPVTLAVAGGHKAMVQALFSGPYVHNIDINSKDGIGQTPLLTAVRRGNKAMVKHPLMDERIQLGRQDNYGHRTVIGL